MRISTFYKCSRLSLVLLANHTLFCAPDTDADAAHLHISVGQSFDRVKFFSIFKNFEIVFVNAAAAKFFHNLPIG